MTNELIRPELPRVDEDDLEYIKQGPYYGAIYHHEGEPFTGFAVMDRYANGLIQLEAEHVDGEQVGWEVSYHSNGEVAEKTLRYGATIIVFYRYDRTGDETAVVFLAPIKMYNQCAQLTGMEPIDEE